MSFDVSYAVVFLSHFLFFIFTVQIVAVIYHVLDLVSSVFSTSLQDSAFLIAEMQLFQWVLWESAGLNLKKAKQLQ